MRWAMRWAMKTESGRLIVEFGALAPPLREQLKGTGISRTNIAGFQASADAIVRLAVEQILTGRERDKAMKRLCEKIGREVRR